MIFQENHLLRLSGNKMICIKADIPSEICEIDDELKAIYHSKDTVCFLYSKNEKIEIGFSMKLLGCLKKKERNTMHHSINEIFFYIL